MTTNKRLAVIKAVNRQIQEMRRPHGRIAVEYNLTDLSEQFTSLRVGSTGLLDKLF